MPRQKRQQQQQPRRNQKRLAKAPAASSAPAVLPALAPAVLPALAPAVLPTLAPAVLPTLAPAVLPTLAPAATSPPVSNAIPAPALAPAAPIYPTASSVQLSLSAPPDPFGIPWPSQILQSQVVWERAGPSPPQLARPSHVPPSTPGPEPLPESHFRPFYPQDAYGRSTMYITVDPRYLPSAALWGESGAASNIESWAGADAVWSRPGQAFDLSFPSWNEVYRRGWNASTGPAPPERPKRTAQRPPCEDHCPVCNFVKWHAQRDAEGAVRAGRTLLAHKSRTALLLEFPPIGELVSTKALGEDGIDDPDDFIYKSENRVLANLEPEDAAATPQESLTAPALGEAVWWYVAIYRAHIQNMHPLMMNVHLYAIVDRWLARAPADKQSRFPTDADLIDNTIAVLVLALGRVCLKSIPRPEGMPEHDAGAIDYLTGLVLATLPVGCSLKHVHIYILAALYYVQVGLMVDAAGLIKRAAEALVALVEGNFWFGEYRMGEMVVTDHWESAVCLAFFTCFHLECDILAEVPSQPFSHLFCYYQMIPEPHVHLSPIPETMSGASLAVRDSYLANIFLRERLIRIERPWACREEPRDIVVEHELSYARKNFQGLFAKHHFTEQYERVEPVPWFLRARFRESWTRMRVTLLRPCLEQVLVLGHNLATGENEPITDTLGRVKMDKVIPQDTKSIVDVEFEIKRDAELCLTYIFDYLEVYHSQPRGQYVVDNGFSVAMEHFRYILLLVAASRDAFLSEFVDASRLTRCIQATIFDFHHLALGSGIISRAFRILNLLSPKAPMEPVPHYFALPRPDFRERKPIMRHYEPMVSASGEHPRYNKTLQNRSTTAAAEAAATTKEEKAAARAERRREKVKRKKEKMWKKAGAPGPAASFRTLDGQLCTVGFNVPSSQSDDPLCYAALYLDPRIFK